MTDAFPKKGAILERLENYCHCSEAVDFKCIPCQSREEIERLNAVITEAQRRIEELEAQK